MDGMAQFESRMAHSDTKPFDNSQSRLTTVYANSVPRRTHNRTQSATDADHHSTNSESHMRSVIGPSASIPEYLGQTNGAGVGAYDENDGMRMSKNYNLADAELEMKKTPKQPKVELLNFKPLVEEEGVGVEGEELGQPNETDMTLSQQEFASDIDAKIGAMLRNRKVSERSGRVHKSVAPPTRANMKEVMNMMPGTKKKTSYSEARRQARNSIHGVPWEMDKDLELEETRKERESRLHKKLEKKQQRHTKAASAVLTGYYPKKETFDTSPSIPEEGDPPSTRQLTSTPLFSTQNRTGETLSTSASFEFASPYSPSPSTHVRSLSPTQELVPQMDVESPSRHLVTGSVSRSESTSSGKSTNAQGQGRTVYRPNLADTHLSDVAVFGKHFDPSQATQERMEANVGDVSMIGLNPTTSPVRSKMREKEKRRPESDAMGVHSGSLRLEPRQVSKSASASPRRTKNRTRLSSLRSGDQERDELMSWEQQLPSSISFNSAILSTPSRYKMNRVSHGFREPTHEENGDVFGEEVEKGSMPEIFRRPALSVSTFSSSHESRGIREGTPESGASDESKSKRRRSIGFSFGRKLSTSMKELFVKEKKSPTSKTTWFFESGGIYPAPSEPQLSILTEQERKEILEETEMVPRTRSTEAMSSYRVQPVGVTNEPSKEENPLAHLFVPPSSVSSTNSEHLGQSMQSAPPTGFFEERSVDGPPSKNKREESEDEYETASDSEENHVKSVVSIITQPATSDTVLREAGYFASSVETGAQKDVATPQTAPTKGQNSPSGSFKMPASEGDPIVKTLDGIVGKSRKDIGGGKMDHMSSPKSSAYSKSKNKDKTAVDENSKDKKLFGRFSKQQKTALQQQSPSPRALSPSSSVGSRQSSGRLSPSRKLSNNSSTENVDNTRRASNTSVGSSPRGSFRGGLTSAGGRVSPGGNFKRGVNSPARGSGRGTVTLMATSGLNFQRGVGSPTSSGLNSPRGSFRGGANTSSGCGSQQGNTRGLKTLTPGGRGSPMQRNTSPRSSFHASPPSTRKDISSTAKSSASRPGVSHLTSHTHSPTQKRRSSEPVSPSGTPLATPKPISGTRERSRGSTSSTRETPKPVRQAPPPPLKSGTSPSISRTSSQTSATSSGSSPRQRKKGMSMPESPVSPQKFSVDVHIPAPIGEESSVKNDQEVDKLLSTVSEKLAPLSASPEEPNPLDQQNEFEIPPPFVEKTSLTPPPHVADDLASSHDSRRGDVPTPDIVVTPEDSPVPTRKGPRPRTIQVITSLIGRKKGGKESPAPKSKGTSSDLQPTGRSSLRKPKPPAGIENGRASPSTKKITVAVKKTATPKEPPSTTNSVPTGLPPKGSSVRKNNTSSRSQSTIEPPTIQVTEARKSFRKMSTPATGNLTTGGPKPSRLGVGNQNSLARSSIRVTGKLKKNNPTSPEHRKASTLNRPKLGDRPPSRGSVHSLPRNASAARSSVRRPARVAPVAPGRAPMRKISSGSEVANRNRSSSLTVQNLPRPRQSVISKSMRKTSTLLPPSHAGDSLKRTTATRSMRMSSSRKVSSLGTMPRASVVSRLGGPASTGNLQSPVGRKSLRKTSSAKDAFDVFDQISADAKGNL